MRAPNDARPVAARPVAARPVATRSRRMAWLVVPLLAALAGCGSTVKLEETPVETRTPVIASGQDKLPQAGAGEGQASSSGVGTAPVASVDLGRSDAAATAGVDGMPVSSGRTIFFDYDSYVVRADARPVLEAQARRLAAQRSLRMLVEGHTDERGGREYNLALGQKRAEAVVRALSVLGVTEGQMEAVSMGKEKPAATGQDEVSWARNRRVELKDR